MGNFLYIPELDNLVINMDKIVRLWIEEKEIELEIERYLKGYTENDSYFEYIIRESDLSQDVVDKVRYRLHVFFLNKGNL